MHLHVLLAAAAVLRATAENSTAVTRTMTGIHGVVYNMPKGISYSPLLEATVVSDEGNQMVYIANLSSAGSAQVVQLGQYIDSGYVDGDKDNVRFSSPRGIVQISDSPPTFILADSGNHVLRKIVASSLHNVSTSTLIANGSASGFKDGVGKDVLFQIPSYLAYSSSDERKVLFVSDTSNHAIRMVDLKSLQVTSIGAGVSGFIDGIGHLAAFNNPNGLDVTLCCNKTQYVYVADTNNSVVRRIELTGESNYTDTISGGGCNNSCNSPQDGSLSIATFKFPFGLAVLHRYGCSPEEGVIFVTDQYAVRRISIAENAVTTIAGSSVSVDNGRDGVGSFAAFQLPLPIFLLDNSGFRAQFQIGDIDSSSEPMSRLVRLDYTYTSPEPSRCVITDSPSTASPSSAPTTSPHTQSPVTLCPSSLSPSSSSPISSAISTGAPTSVNQDDHYIAPHISLNVPQPFRIGLNNVITAEIKWGDDGSSQPSQSFSELLCSYSWKIVRLASDYRPSLVALENKHVHHSRLYVPSGTLEAGESYALNFTFNSTKSQVVTESVNFETFVSRLLPSIEGGQIREVQRGRGLSLSARSSYDPDSVAGTIHSEHGGDRKEFFAWTCSKKLKDSQIPKNISFDNTSTPCNTSMLQGLNQSELVISGDLWNTSRCYLFQLRFSVVSNGGFLRREEAISVRITVVKDLIPRVTLQAKSTIIPLSARVQLLANAVPSPDSRSTVSDLSYQWGLEDYQITAAFTNDSFRAPYIDIKLSSLLTGIFPAAPSSQNIFVFKVCVTDTRANTSTVATISVSKAETPVITSYSVAPLRAQAFIEEFSATITASSAHLPLKYQLSFNTSQGGRSVILRGFYFNQAGDDARFSLPHVNATVEAKVQDVLGGTSSVFSSLLTSYKSSPTASSLEASAGDDRQVLVGKICNGTKDSLHELSALARHALQGDGIYIEQSIYSVVSSVLEDLKTQQRYENLWLFAQLGLEVVQEMSELAAAYSTTIAACNQINVDLSSAVIRDHDQYQEQGRVITPSAHLSEVARELWARFEVGTSAVLMNEAPYSVVTPRQGSQFLSRLVSSTALNSSVGTAKSFVNATSNLITAMLNNVEQSVGDIDDHSSVDDFANVLSTALERVNYSRCKDGVSEDACVLTGSACSVASLTYKSIDDLLKVQAVRLIPGSDGEEVQQPTFIASSRSRLDSELIEFASPKVDAAIHRDSFVGSGAVRSSYLMSYVTFPNNLASLSFCRPGSSFESEAELSSSTPAFPSSLAPSSNLGDDVRSSSSRGSTKSKIISEVVTSVNLYSNVWGLSNVTKVTSLSSFKNGSSTGSVKLNFAVSEEIATSSCDDAHLPTKLLYRPVCAYWDTIDLRWSDEGCRVQLADYSSDNASYPSPRGFVQCTCDHLTEFAVLRHQLGACGLEDDLGQPWSFTAMYMVFSGLYMIAFCLCVTQLARLLSGSRTVLSSHALLFGTCALVCLLRALLCLFLSSYDSSKGFNSRDAPRGVTLVLVAAPYSLSFWIFSFAVFQWISILHNKRLSRRPFERFKKWFVAVNVAVVALVWLLFGLFLSSKHPGSRDAYLAGPTLMSSLFLFAAVSTLFYGLRVARKVAGIIPTNRFSERSSRKARRLRLVSANSLRLKSLALGAGFVLLSTAGLASALAPSKRTRLILSVAYYSADIINVIMVLKMYNGAIKSRLQKVKVRTRSTRTKTEGTSVMAPNNQLLSGKTGDPSRSSQFDHRKSLPPLSKMSSSQREREVEMMRKRVVSPALIDDGFGIVNEAVCDSYIKEHLPFAADTALNPEFSVFRRSSIRDGALVSDRKSVDSAMSHLEGKLTITRVGSHATVSHRRRSSGDVSLILSPSPRNSLKTEERHRSGDVSLIPNPSPRNSSKTEDHMARPAFDSPFVSADDSDGSSAADMKRRTTDRRVFAL